MNPETTAPILVGYQNDYFAKNGILRGVVEDPGRSTASSPATLDLIRAIAGTTLTIIATPIVLEPDYRALASPVGILNTIKESRAGSRRHVTVPIRSRSWSRSVTGIVYVTGKVGFNAFSNTTLERVLRSAASRTVLVAGMVTSLCIDSTGQRRLRARATTCTILSDCTSARTSPWSRTSSARTSSPCAAP